MWAGLDEDVDPPFINEATFSNQLCVDVKVANDVAAKIIVAIAVRLVIAISRARVFVKIDFFELVDAVVGRVTENILIEAPNYETISWGYRGVSIDRSRVSSDYN